LRFDWGSGIFVIFPDVEQPVIIKESKNISLINEIYPGGLKIINIFTSLKPK
jgi:hypothetical protein